MLEKFQSLPPEKQTENMASAFGDGMDQMVNYVVKIADDTFDELVKKFQ